MNELQIFKNNQFGEIRTVEENDKVIFCGRDVATALGYADTVNALKQHCKGVVKCHLPHPQSKNKTIEMSFISEGDIYHLTAKSQLPSAEKFESWVFDEVLPSIRKTGTYTVKSDKSLEIKEMNARSRMCNQFLKLSKVDTLSKEYKNILVSKATEVLADEQIIPLPKSAQKTYSATELGNMFGVSAQKIGSVTNKHNLKTEEYG